MSRDQRDPTLLGEAYLKHRECPEGERFTIEGAVHIAVRDFDCDAIGPVERYGKPGDLVLVKDAEPPVFTRKK